MNHKGIYLQASERDAQWGLQTTCIGTQLIDIQGVYPPPTHPKDYLMKYGDGRTLDEYQLVYLVSGQGIFESRHCPLRRIQAGDIFLLFPGEWHTYRPLSETGWEEYWVGFKGPDADAKVAKGFFNVHSPVFKIGLSEQLVKLYSQILDLAQKQMSGYQQMMSGIVAHMLGIVYSQSINGVQSTPKIQDLINRAKVYISGNLQSPISASLIAERIKVNYPYFCRIFKQHTGFSPSQYILEMRIQRSKQLLYTTGLNSQQIAYDCGFENSGYFCMVFRKKVGMTPLQYRKLVCGVSE